MPPVFSRPAAAMRRPAGAPRGPQVVQEVGRTEPDGPTGPYGSFFSTRESCAKRQYTRWLMFFAALYSCQLNLRTPDEVDYWSFLDSSDFREYILFLLSHNKHRCSQKGRRMHIHMFGGVCDTQTIARPELVSPLQCSFPNPQD